MPSPTHSVAFSRKQNLRVGLMFLRCLGYELFLCRSDCYAGSLTLTWEKAGEDMWVWLGPFELIISPVYQAGTAAPLGDTDNGRDEQRGEPAA